MDLKYEASFKEKDLINDLSEKIFKQSEYLGREASQRWAERCINYIKTQGNSALYQGLIKIAMEWVMPIINDKEEGYKKDGE